MTRTSAPSAAEMELWPELIWQLATLVKSGLPTREIFAAAHGYLPRPVPPEDALEKLLTATERRTVNTALDDIELLLTRCAQHARYGLSAGQAIGSAMDAEIFSREHSQQRAGELAACWKVSERTGAPIGDMLERLAEFLESEIDLHRARESAMSAPKATGRILSGLPLLGLGLGMLMGAEPLSVLFGSVPGIASAVIGVGLAWAGRAWTTTLVAKAEAGQL